MLVKIFNYEYWPFWVLYFPTVFYWVYNAIITRCATYFTLANPGIERGGVFGESKIEILKKIPAAYLPTTLFFDPQPSYEVVEQAMQHAGLQLPLIGKPDRGEMGFKVSKIETAAALKNYFGSSADKVILQEFIDYEIELGVLYYRMPDGSRSGITSVVGKEFLQVTGDGISTIADLIKQSDRGRLQLKSLQKTLQGKISTVLASGEHLIVEPIGNHCRGTRFINRNDLINAQLLKVFDDIASQIDGFYYGRFDLKVKTIDDLYQGRTIKIMEVNGVTSEPAHIYDTQMTLPKAYKAIFDNMRIVRLIARQNQQKGMVAISTKELLATAFQHFRKKKHDAH